jgi:hypothetical protein
MNILYFLYSTMPILTLSSWISIVGIVVTIVAAIFGTIFTVRYASIYHVTKKGKGREKWFILEKVTLAAQSRHVDSARLVLQKSSFLHAQGFVDVSLTQNDLTILVDRYATIHSCIHALFAPGKIIAKNESSWQEQTYSNEFAYLIVAKTLDSIPIELVDEKLRARLSNCKAIEFAFSFPDTYTGPRYKKRTLILGIGIGIVACKTEYVNGDIDSYRLVSYKVKPGGEQLWLPVKTPGNWWVYDITFDYGPNDTNICE